MIKEDWIESTLGEVSVVGAGSPAPQGQEHFEQGSKPFIRVKDMGKLGSNKVISDAEDHLNEKGIKKLKLIPKGSVLFTKSGASTLLNQRALIDRDMYVVSHIGFATPHSVVTSNYLYYFMKLIDFGIFAHATTLPSLPLSKAKSIKIPIAPLPEQRAIVSKIEELFSDLDKGVTDLKKAQDQLKVYRQAVLKKAFEGELTKEWREQQTALPTADELLEQIKEERQKHYEQQLENWKLAVKSWEENGKEGKKPGKPKAKSSLPVLTKEEKSALPALSSSWSWIKLDQIGELFCGQSPSVSEVNKEGKGMLYVTGPEQWNGREIEEIKWTEFPKRIVPDGSIFITVKGAGVGKLFPGIHCAIGRDVYAFKPDTKINFKYVYHALKHSIDIVVMKALGDIPGLSKNHILDHYLGFCSQEEQHQIVQEIESRLSVCDKVEESIIESLEKAKALRQSILKKAFEGRLLSTQEIEKCKAAPDYEPAAVLLEKIKMK